MPSALSFGVDGIVVYLLCLVGKMQGRNTVMTMRIRQFAIYALMSGVLVAVGNVRAEAGLEAVIVSKIRLGELEAVQSKNAQLEYEQTANNHAEMSPEELVRQKELRDKIVKDLLDDMLPVPGVQFRMGRTEVTEAQWDAVMGQDNSIVRDSRYPISATSWNDCQEFIIRLNLIPAVRDSGLKFRLPEVDEWRYVCRAGSRGNWGMLSADRPGNLPEMGWYADNSRNGKSPVAQKKPNAWGFYDMHGNVWEWCADVSAEYGGDFRSRVGGSFATAAESCAVKFVNSADRQFSNYVDQGFRLLAE